jgi:hypothetical protein
MQAKRFVLAALCSLMLAGDTIGEATAHHGWRWAEADNSEITGTIKRTQLGNPHGLLYIDVSGEEWTAEVGQPWRNERAGLTNNMLAQGVTITIRGHRATDKNQKVIKAERVVIDGKTYELYPERD